MTLAGPVLNHTIPVSCSGGGASDGNFLRLSPCLEFLMKSTTTAANCLDVFHLLTASQLPELFSLSSSAGHRLHNLGYVICDQSTSLTLKKLEGKTWSEVGCVHLQCSDMKAMEQEWKLSKWFVPHNKFNQTLWFVMLGAIFEFLRQSHLKVQVAKGVRSLHEASARSLRLVNDCSRRDDFATGEYKPAAWRQFTRLSAGFECELNFWRIPAMPEDYYRKLLNCPPGHSRSIKFQCPAKDN